MAASNSAALGLVVVHAGMLVGFGLAVTAPGDLLPGVAAILTARDALLTDYVGVGGLGPACLNAGLLGLAAAGIRLLSGAPVAGLSVAALYLLMGFGLFGKNPLNVAVIVGAVHLCARLRREPAGGIADVALMCSALSPLVSEILFSSRLEPPLAVALAVLSAMAVGFATPPIARQLSRAHDGHMLYNVGFAAGVVGLIVYALLRGHGLVPQPVVIWTRDAARPLTGLLALMLAATFFAGPAIDRRAFRRLWELMRRSGQAPFDALRDVGEGTVFANIALVGAIGLGYLLLVGADVNGPTCGAVLAMSGFAACGKHPLNVAPVMLGVWLAAVTQAVGPADPTLVLAALFGGALAPVAGRFGLHWGVAAGYLHGALAMVVGSRAPGLNLYNNGFVAGIVAVALAPTILAIRQALGTDAASRVTDAARTGATSATGAQAEPDRRAPGPAEAAGGRAGDAEREADVHDRPPP